MSRKRKVLLLQSLARKATKGRVEEDLVDVTVMGVVDYNNRVDCYIIIFQHKAMPNIEYIISVSFNHRKYVLVL